MNVFDTINITGILPVVKLDELENAVPLATALREGGVNAIEVTARTPVAFDAIRAIRAAYPDMAVGAGTILNREMVDKAVEAGAKYIVAPGFNTDTAEYCRQLGVPFVPGCTTASEMEKALAMGITTVKFFPAEANGGLAALKLFAGPFPQLSFVVTGGVDFTNIGEYLKHGFIGACGGSYMAPAALVKEKNWAQITANCKRAVALSLGFELAHVGLNHPDEAAALANADALNQIFQLGVRNGNSSAFCGKAVEFMKTMFYGEKGHIGFYVNSVARAKAWFESRNIAIREESVRMKDAKTMQSFYLQEEIGGFAVHVVAR